MILSIIWLIVLLAAALYAISRIFPERNRGFVPYSKETLPGLVFAVFALMVLAAAFYTFQKLPTITAQPILIGFNLALTVAFLIGLYLVVVRKSLYRILIGLLIMEVSVEGFLIAAGEHQGFTALTGTIMIIALAVLMGKVQKASRTQDVTKLEELKG
jgi:hydrogenase-4 membrane subunit HyfE